MLPFSRDRGFAQGELEKAGKETMTRTRRAGSNFATAGAVFVACYVKFAYLVPVAAAPLWEKILWLSSAALLLPTLLWFVHAVWGEWRAYFQLAALTGHPGTVADSTKAARARLFLEFCRAGRS